MPKNLLVLKKCLVLFALAVIHTNVQAQQPFVRGEVINLRSEEKVAGASISIVGKRGGLISAENGTFTLPSDNLSITDSLVISAIGFDTDTIPFSPTKKFYAIYLKPTGKSLDEVVISGTLKELSKSASPIPVETYSAKFFKKNVTPSIFEALTIVNGVQPQLNCNVCNTGDIHINGMEGPYTMVLIDGMPIVSNLATVYGFSGIPASLIKRVEVVKGPASTLYGSEAVAGLINIITKDPAGSARLATDVNISSYQEVNADISAKFSIGKASSLIGVNAFLFKKKFDINDDNFTDVTLQKRLSLFNKWDIERKNQQPMRIAARFIAEDRWGGEMQFSKQWRGTDSIYGESIYTRRFELIGNYGLPVYNESLLVEYSYNYHNQDSYYGASPYMAVQHTAFAQLRWDKTIGKHNFLSGIPFRYTWYDDNTAATAKPDGIANNPALSTTGGIFLQDEIKITSTFTTLAGLRFERSSLQGNILSPRLAFKIQPAKDHTVRISSGNGYRVVNLFTEDHLALSGARELVITEILKPEKSWNSNINYTGTFTPGFGYLNIDFSAFYTHFSNKIVADYNTDPQKIIYSNLRGYAISKGVSSNMEFTFKKGLKILTGFTLMDVYTMDEDLEGKKTRQKQLFAPTFSATYAVSYTVPAWKTTFDFTGKVYGPERLPIVPDDFRPGYSPWFTLANLQTTKKMSSEVEVYLGLKNLFNFLPDNPILRPFDPFDKNVTDPINNPNGYTFDPSYNYAPIQRIKAMIGFRYTL